MTSPGEAAAAIVEAAMVRAVENLAPTEYRKFLDELEAEILSRSDLLRHEGF